MAIDFIKYNELEDVLKEESIKIVNFYAEWCGPCKMMAPILEDISSEIEVYKINTEEDKEGVAKENIKGIPLTRVYKDGKIIKEITGFVPKEVLMDSLK